MKYSHRLTVADLLFSAMLGALAVFIYRRWINPPAARGVKSPPLRIRTVIYLPEPTLPYQRRLPPLV
jgi:hypothetical protein